MVTCLCGSQYVGKTVRKVGTRILEHISALGRKDYKSAVARHIQEKHEGAMDV